MCVRPDQPTSQKHLTGRVLAVQSKAQLFRSSIVLSMERNAGPGESTLSPTKPAMGSFMKGKLLKRFYEVLVLLRVLGQVQGEKVAGPPAGDGNPDHLDAVQMRRKVLYHLCVMCDFVKGGDTVTAMAIQKLPSGPVYWIATNRYLPKIKLFLEKVLEMLQARAVSNSPESGTDFEDELFQIFFDFQYQRIKTYIGWLRHSVCDELQRISNWPSSSRNASAYMQWLTRFELALEQSNLVLPILELAWAERHSQFLRVDFDPVTSLPTKVENTLRINLRHYIGRLCALRRAAKFISYAATSQGDMFLDFSIRGQETGSPSQRPSTHTGLTLEGISGRMFSNSANEPSEFRAALLSLESKGQIIDRVMDHYDNKAWRPRVHAELALLEALHLSQVRYFDDDKYIACSKPACFCCYHYICAHPGSFERPPCHNKVYLAWQPPALDPKSGEKHFSQQRDVMNKLIEQLRLAVIEKVLNAHQHTRWHPDSSTGITPMHVAEFCPDVVPSSRRGSSERGSCDGSEPRLEAFRPISEARHDESYGDDLEGSSGNDSEDGGVRLESEAAGQA